MSLIWLRIAVILYALASFSLTAAAQSDGATSLKQDTDPVIHDLCNKQVAMLGESPVHGFGKTLEFKVELVRRLVDECHFNALFIESGTYDYIDIQKKLKSGQDVTDDMLSAAIGFLWATKEVQPLIPFLRERIKAGSLTLGLGGLDDQIDMGTYAQHEMPADLTEYLHGDERTWCLAVLQRHMLWQYTDDAPYGPADKAKILGCLDEIETRIAQPEEGTAPWAEEDTAMVDSLKRYFARDLAPNHTKSERVMGWNARDRSMYQNFQWLFSRLPPHSKVIVWAATVHVAKDESAVSEWDGSIPFGSYLHHDFGDRSFALGFSALSGSYVVVRPPGKQLSVAPVNSLEGRSFANRVTDTVYLSSLQLRRLGPIAARPLGTTFDTAQWNKILDGLVVFREERPPEYPHP